MDLSPELALALLAYLPQGVLLLDMSGEEPTVLYALGGDAAAGSRVEGPTPLAKLMGWAADAPEFADLLVRLEAGAGATLDWPREGGALTLQLLPLPRGSDGARYYIGLERTPDPDAARAAAGGVPVVVREDRLTGLSHRDWFFELYRRDFQVAARERRALSLFVIDIDALGSYNDTFGRSAGDSLIRQVGRAVMSGMRRAGDLVAREHGGRYVALASGQSPDQARRHAEVLAARVRDLHLHHPRSGVARFVTVSIGVAHWHAAGGEGEPLTPDALYGASLAALARSRQDGRNRVTLSAIGAA